MSRVQVAPRGPRVPSGPIGSKPQKAAFLTAQIARAHAVLADPKASYQKRCAARKRLNRICQISKALQPIPPMKRKLDVDKGVSPSNDLGRGALRAARFHRRGESVEKALLP